MDAPKVIKWRPEGSESRRPEFRNPPIALGTRRTPLSSTLASRDVVSTWDSWISPDTILRLGNETGYDNPLKILRAALFVWSKGELGGREGGVESFLDDLVVGLGYVSEDEIEKRRKEILEGTRDGPGLEYRFQVPVGKQICLEPILRVGVLDTVFELCQVVDGTSEAEMDGSTGASTRKEEGSVLRLPGHLKPDYTIILKGEPPAESAKVATPETEVEPARKILKTANTDVEIGRFHVHKCMLAMMSGYYAAMFRGPWVDSKEAISTLSSEVIGTPFGLQETLRFIYTGASLNRPVLAPSVDAEGNPGPLQPTPLFMNFDYDRMFFDFRSEASYYESKETRPRKFLSSLKTIPQLENYLHQNFSVLQASEYFLFDQRSMVVVPSSYLHLNINTLIIGADRTIPYSDLVSRLPSILDLYPKGLECVRQSIMDAMLDENINFRHWKPPMLSWPPHIITILLDAVLLYIDEPPVYGLVGTHIYAFFNSLGKFRRSIRSSQPTLFPEWETKIFGPVRTVLAEKILKIVKECGQWHTIDEAKEEEEAVNEISARSWYFESDRDDSTEQEEEEEVVDEKDGTDRLIMDPKHAGELLVILQIKLRQLQDGSTSGHKISARRRRKAQDAVKDYMFWGFHAGLWRNGRYKEKFHIEDICDLLWRCATPKGEDVVDTRTTGRACGGEGLLSAENVKQVEKLLDAIDCEEMFCAGVKKTSDGYRREVGRLCLDDRGDLGMVIEEVKVLRERVERAREKWDSEREE